MTSPNSKINERRAACGLLLMLTVWVGCEGSEFALRAQRPAIQSYANTVQPHTVTLRWQELNDELMQAVCQRESLRELRLISSTHEDLAILPYVAQLPNLEALSIIEVSITDDELQALAGAKHLTSLELSRTGITGSGLKHLAKLPLKQLVIGENVLTIAGLQAIASMTELEELELVVPNLQVANVPALACLEKLTTVTISDGCFSYRKYGGLKWLVNAPRLRTLHLAGSNLNNRTLESISTLDCLQNLTIEKWMISEEGVQQLARLEQLRMVNIPAMDTIDNQPHLRLAEHVEEEPVPKPIRG